MKKNILIGILLVVALVLFGGPGILAEQHDTVEPSIVNALSEEDSSMTNNKTLVAYFSMPETTDPNNMTIEEANSTVVIDGEVLGNTQYVAYVIAQNTGADIFRIEPETPYPLEHSELEKIAIRDQQENARPKIAATVENMEQYDTIFLGFPNWNYDMPMIIYSFLDQYDLSGKTIAPFVTSGASGFSGSIDAIVQMEPEANVITDGLSILRNVVQDSETVIIQWLADQGFMQ